MTTSLPIPNVFNMKYLSTAFVFVTATFLNSAVASVFANKPLLSLSKNNQVFGCTKELKKNGTTYYLIVTGTENSKKEFEIITNVTAVNGSTINEVSKTFPAENIGDPRDAINYSNPPAKNERKTLHIFAHMEEDRFDIAVALAQGPLSYASILDTTIAIRDESANIHLKKVTFRRLTCHMNAAALVAFERNVEVAKQLSLNKRTSPLKASTQAL